MDRRGRPLGGDGEPRGVPSAGGEGGDGADPHLLFRGIVTFVPGPDQVEYMCVYTADGFAGDLRECSEGELRWIPKEEVESLSLWEGDRLFMPLLLREDVPFFSMKLVYEGDRLIYAGAAERAENASGRVRIAGGPEEGWRLVWEKSFC